MRYLLIDPAERTVTEHDPRKLGREFFYREIRCDIFERVAFAPGVDMWVDEHGLLGEKPDPTFFTVAGTGKLFSGRAVLCGRDSLGNCRAAPAGVTIAKVAALIVFLGGETDVEAAIARGEIMRPESAIVSPGGRREVFWTWHPSAGVAP